MPTLRHANNGNCIKCAEIFDSYVGVNKDIREWFQHLQNLHPSAHISCAGRGRVAQEKAVADGASRAHYGQSAHNYNCAIDIFVMQQGLDLYDKKWFHEVVAPNLEPFLKWYGAPDAVFKELPHVEISDWHDLKTRGVVKLVE